MRSAVPGEFRGTRYAVSYCMMTADFTSVSLTVLVITYASWQMYTYSRRSRALRELIPQLGGHIHHSLTVPRLVTEVDSYPVVILPGRRGLFSTTIPPIPFYLTIDVRVGVPFLAGVENRKADFSSGFDTWFAVYGKNHPRRITTGEERFDHQALISSQQTEMVTRYFRETKAQQAVATLFQLGFDPILLDSRRIRVQKPNYRLERDVTVTTMSQVVDQLTALADVSKTLGLTISPGSRSWTTHNIDWLVLSNFALAFVGVGAIILAIGINCVVQTDILNFMGWGIGMVGAISMGVGFWMSWVTAHQKTS